MDTGSCFWTVAGVVYIFTVLWMLKKGPGVGFWTAAATTIVGACLYLTVPLVVHGFLLIGCSFILIYGAKRRVEFLPVKSRTVLITGCDSGFGNILAQQLSEMGVAVFAGVLDVNGEGAQQLRERGCENLQVLQLDVTDASQIEAAHNYICTKVADKGLWGLVNNAGVLHCIMDAEIQPMATYRHCLDVNFLGAVKMCQVFLPLLRRSRGRIVNVSSLAGGVPVPMFAAYGASKAALTNFTKVLRLELSSWGVQVALLEPTGFRTNIFGTSDDAARSRDKILAALSSDVREDYGEAYISSLSSSMSRMSKQVAADLSPVVDDMIHALLSAQPKPVYTPGQMAWLLPVLHHCFPTVYDLISLKHLNQADCKPAGLSRS